MAAGVPAVQPQHQALRVGCKWVGWIGRIGNCSRNARALLGHARAGLSQNPTRLPHLAQQSVQLAGAQPQLGQAAVGGDAQHRLLQERGRETQPWLDGMFERKPQTLRDARGMLFRALGSFRGMGG